MYNSADHATNVFAALALSHCIPDMPGAAANPYAATAALAALKWATLARRSFPLLLDYPSVTMSVLSRLQALLRRLRALAGSGDEQASAALVDEAHQLFYEQVVPLAGSEPAVKRWR